MPYLQTGVNAGAGIDWSVKVGGKSGFQINQFFFGIDGGMEFGNGSSPVHQQLYLGEQISSGPYGAAIFEIKF